MSEVLSDLRLEFERQKRLADRAMEGLDDAAFFRSPGEAVNPVATIVKHMAGNLASRWTDFLSTDGEKPWRDRDSEFVVEAEKDTRESIVGAWERGWSGLFATLDALTAGDLGRTITIRGEGMTVQQAILRAVTHAAYHTGQVLYVARLLAPGSAWQTIAPGQSRGATGTYRSPSGG
jgi:uncharacterized damage-inducible protein DinB